LRDNYSPVPFGDCYFSEIIALLPEINYNIMVGSSIYKWNEYAECAENGVEMNNNRAITREW